MKNNCYVVINCGDNPSFGGQYKTPEDVVEAYAKYPSFTGRVYTSLPAAAKEMYRLDATLKEGDSCYVVCGCYCKQYDLKLMAKKRRSQQL